MPESAGYIDRLYDGVNKKIGSISNEYARQYVRGFVSLPFVISGLFDYFLFNESDPFSLYAKMRKSEQAEEKRMEKFLAHTAGYWSNFGLVYALGYVFHFPVIVTSEMGAGALLDGLNCLERKIRGHGKK